LSRVYQLLTLAYLYIETQSNTFSFTLAGEKETRLNIEPGRLIFNAIRNLIYE